MIDYKKHPFDYITSGNFDKIKSVMSMGMASNSSPLDIVRRMVDVTGLEEKICMGIVIEELGGTMNNLKDSKNGK